MIYRCPHCGQDCLSIAQKLFMSPANPVSCRNCGRSVTLRWSHYLLVIVPAVIALALIGRFGFEGYQLLAAGGALLAAVGLAQLLLPLVKAGFRSGTGSGRDDG